MFEKTFKLSYQVPGYGFDAVFGAMEDDVHLQSDVTLTDGAQTYVLSKNRHAETFRDIRGDVLYRYENGAAAILSHTYGSGRA